ncbi:MAG: hypothetical protein IJ660_08120 [Alphaproteobacteria bacterium]|nr:hypothetical protein [Alphaproteobacteria bacterium]
MEKTSLAKYIVGLILLIITGILAAATIYFDAFMPLFQGLKTWTYDDYALVAVITLIFGLLFVLFLFPVFVTIWDYIGEEYGKKQHLLNVCWLILCCAFAYFAVCFPNVLIKIGKFPAISELSLQLYRLVIILITWFLLCWLCHLVDYYKHLLEYLEIPMRKPRGENIVSEN